VNTFEDLEKKLMKDPEFREEYLKYPSSYCPICNSSKVKYIKLEDGNVELPNCLICKGHSIYGGQFLGYPSKYDGGFICADCLAEAIDARIDEVER